MMSRPPQHPVREFRAGTISAAVWSNTETRDGKSIPQHSIRVQKRYRDERTGEWKTTSYFRPDDMPRLALVAQKVFEYVILRDNTTITSKVGRMDSQ
jgi:hypothetical protein